MDACPFAVSPNHMVERIYSTFFQVLEYMSPLNFCNFFPNLKPSEGPPATADLCLEQQVVTLALTFNCCSSLCRKVATQQLLHSPKGPHSATHSMHPCHTLATLYHTLPKEQTLGHTLALKDCTTFETPLKR